MNLFIGPLALL